MFLYMRALIVDDELVARKILREELELLNDRIEAIEEADNGEAALLKISVFKPDVVFLDIQMPVMSGFEVLNRLNGGYLPAIVIVTAYDQHAMQAFEAGAVDYLLKPIRPERLIQAVERATKIVRNPLQAAEKLAELQKILPTNDRRTGTARKFVGRLDEDFFLLSPEEIVAFQAEGDTTWIITANQRLRATQNLKSLEDRVAGSSFRRIHRNALVNVDQIRKMSMLTSQRWLVTLNNGQEFIVSKRQARNVRDVLHW